MKEYLQYERENIVKSNDIKFDLELFREGKEIGDR